MTPVSNENMTSLMNDILSWLLCLYGQYCQDKTRNPLGKPGSQSDWYTVIHHNTVFYIFSGAETPIKANEFFNVI